MTDKKISIDQMYKESEELTKKEMENLLIHISNNPTLLKPRKFSESEYSDSSDSSRTLSTYSSSSNNKSLEIYKKDNKIDELDKKLYYKNLHLTNISLENTKLKDENEILKTKLKTRELLFTIIINLVDFLLENSPKELDKITKENVFNHKITIENQLKNSKNKLDDINNKIDTVLNPKVKKFFQNEIIRMNKKIEKNYEDNYKTINNFIISNKRWELLTNISFMFVGGIILLFVKEIFF